MLYRVNGGSHEHPDGSRILETGEVFETDEDMLKYNGFGMTPKFLPAFERMSDQQLMAYAEKRKVDYRDCETRQDLIKKLGG